MANFRISRLVLADAQAHAEQEYPRESCGVVIRTPNKTTKYWRCKNIARTPSEHFIIDPYDQVEAEEEGEIIAVVHSHPNGNPRPSEADRIGCRNSQVPWIVLSVPNNGYKRIDPEDDYKAPLLGRQFAHGILDCWALCRDFYLREAGIELPDFERSDRWWEDGESPSLYEKYYAEAGFYEVDINDIKRGDMLVMQIGRSIYPNHAVIYLGSDCTLTSEPTYLIRGVGPFFIHHMYGQDSQRAIYGRIWQDRVRLALRHKEFKQW